MVGQHGIWSHVRGDLDQVGYGFLIQTPRGSPGQVRSRSQGMQTTGLYVRAQNTDALLRAGFCPERPSGHGRLQP